MGERERKMAVQGKKAEGEGLVCRMFVEVIEKQRFTDKAEQNLKKNSGEC